MISDIVAPSMMKKEAHHPEAIGDMSRSFPGSGLLINEERLADVSEACDHKVPA